MNMSIKMTVRTETGKSHPVEAPPEIKAQELIDELLKAFELPRIDAKGNRIQWTLVDKDTGRTVDPQKSLEQNGIRNGHILYLHVRAPIAPPIAPVFHIPDIDAFSEAIQQQEKVGDLVRDLASRLRLDSTTWRVYDKDLGTFLDPDKSLSENGVLTGHHLH